MATITLTTAQEQLALWVAANAALSTGQTFSMNGRSLTRADTADVLKQIDYWSGVEARLERQAAGGKNLGRVGFSVARF